MTAEDAQLGELKRRFPQWQIWYVPLALGGNTWCANPWAKQEDRTGVLHADTAEHIADEIREYEREHAGQPLAGP